MEGEGKLKRESVFLGLFVFLWDLFLSTIFPFRTIAKKNECLWEAGSHINCGS